MDATRILAYLLGFHMAPNRPSRYLRILQKRCFHRKKSWQRSWLMLFDEQQLGNESIINPIWEFLRDENGAPELNWYFEVEEDCRNHETVQRKGWDEASKRMKPCNGWAAGKEIRSETQRPHETHLADIMTRVGDHLRVSGNQGRSNDGVRGSWRGTMKSGQGQLLVDLVIDRGVGCKLQLMGCSAGIFVFYSMLCCRNGIIMCKEASLLIVSAKL